MWQPSDKDHGIISKMYFYYNIVAYFFCLKSEAQCVGQAGFEFIIYMLQTPEF